MEAGSGNLALLHCSCFACLLSGVFDTEYFENRLNTTCITINRVV